MKHAWRIWAKALGAKEGKNDKEADYVALLRTFILISYFTTNCFIVAGVVRHWNDVEYGQKSSLPLCVKCGIINTHNFT